MSTARGLRRGEREHGAAQLQLRRQIHGPRRRGVRAVRKRHHHHTGKFKEVVSSAECDACEAGKYLEIMDVSSPGACVACDADTYSTAVGSSAASTCVSCPASSSSVSGSSVLTVCRCNMGFSGDYGGPCAACEAGTYKDALGSVACSQCVENSTSLNASVSLENCLCLCKNNKRYHHLCDHAVFICTDGSPMRSVIRCLFFLIFPLYVEVRHSQLVSATSLWLHLKFIADD